MVEQTWVDPSGVQNVRPVLPYDGEYGRDVGEGHVNYRTRRCMVCDKSIGNYHADGCPESYRDLNAERQFKDYSLDELLIIEEISGVPFRGTGWGGFGEPVTVEEMHASTPSPDRKRYMPPPTRTLQQAIDLVKAQFTATTKERAAPDVRTWAREHGYQVGSRGRLSSAILAAYRETSNG